MNNAKFNNVLTTILPLPKGEGQGEVEQRIQTPQTSRKTFNFQLSTFNFQPRRLSTLLPVLALFIPLALNVHAQFPGGGGGGGFPFGGGGQGGANRQSATRRT